MKSLSIEIVFLRFVNHFLMGMGTIFLCLLIHLPQSSAQTWKKLALSGGENTDGFFNDVRLLLNANGLETSRGFKK